MLKNIPSNRKGALYIAQTYRWFMEDQHRIYERPIMFIEAAIYAHNLGIISNGRYEDCWKAFRQAMEKKMKTNNPYDEIVEPTINQKWGGYEDD